MAEYRISFTVELDSPPDVEWLGKGPLKDWTVEEIPPDVVVEPEPEPEPKFKTYRVSFLVTLPEGDEPPTEEWLGKENVRDFEAEEAPHPDNTLPGDLPPTDPGEPEQPVDPNDQPHPDQTLPGDLPPDARRGGRRN